MRDGQLNSSVCLDKNKILPDYFSSWEILIILFACFERLLTNVMEWYARGFGFGQNNENEDAHEDLKYKTRYAAKTMSSAGSGIGLQFIIIIMFIICMSIFIFSEETKYILCPFFFVFYQKYQSMLPRWQVMQSTSSLRKRVSL